MSHVMYVIERHFNRKRYFLADVSLPPPAGCRIERVWTTSPRNALCGNRKMMQMFLVQHNLQETAHVAGLDLDPLLREDGYLT